jgi:hypothetical protein
MGTTVTPRCSYPNLHFDNLGCLEDQEFPQVICVPFYDLEDIQVDEAQKCAVNMRAWRAANRA